MRPIALAIAAWLLGPAHGTWAAEISLIAPGGIKSSLEALVPAFEKKTGHKVTMTFGSDDGTRDQVAQGAAFDVPIIEPPLDSVIASGRVDARSATPLASAVVGIALRAGQPKPRIATREDLRFLMLRANRIAVPDAANGVAAGQSFAKTLAMLDLIARVDPKLHLAPSGAAAMSMLAKGQADVGVALVSEMIGVPGTEIVGKLPIEFSPRLRYVAFIASEARNIDAARALVAYLSAPAEAGAYRAHGMEPAH